MKDNLFVNMKFDDFGAEMAHDVPVSDSFDETTDDRKSNDEESTVREDNTVVESCNESHSSTADGECAVNASLDENALEAGQKCETDDASEQLKQTADDINSSLKLLSSKITSIETQISRLAAYDTAVETLKRSLISNQNRENNLYKEVEAYKRGTYFTNIRPFLSFIVEMLCEMKKSKKQYIDDKETFVDEHGEAIFDEICSLLDFYIGAFESQLTVQGVTIMSYEAGEKYMAINQHIVKTISTESKEMNGIVAEVISDCYMYDKTVLKPAKVNVYKSIPKTANSSAEEN